MTSRIDMRHQQAWDAYERGDLRGALRIATTCLRRSRDDGRAWELCGLIHFAGGNDRESVQALERASLLVPLRPSGRVCLGHAYAKIGKVRLATDLLRDLIENDSMTVPLLLHIANGLNSLGRPDLAMLACRKAVARDDAFAPAHYWLGYFAGKCGQPEHLVEAMIRKAIALAPQVASYRIALAGMLERRGAVEQAAQLVRNLTNSDLESITCMGCAERMIRLYEHTGDYRRVVVCRQHLLRLEVSESR